MDRTERETNEHHERCEQLTRDEERAELIRTADVEITRLSPGKPPDDLYSRYPTRKTGKRRMTDLDAYEDEDLLTWQDLGSGWVSEHDIDQITYLDIWEKMLLTAFYGDGKTIESIADEFQISVNTVNRELSKIREKLESRRKI